MDTEAGWVQRRTEAFQAQLARQRTFWEGISRSAAEGGQRRIAAILDRIGEAKLRLSELAEFHQALAEGRTWTAAAPESPDATGERSGREPPGPPPPPVAVPRRDWPAGFPDVVQHGVANIRALPGWAEAKAGDTHAAFRLVADAVRADRIEALRAIIGDEPAVMVPVIPQEGGRNAIPLNFAKRLGDALGLAVTTDIVRVDTTRRTNLPGTHRLVTRSRFEGAVEPGRAYVIVDDVVTQGGTVADLRAHIEAGGGRVVAVTALQAPGANARLAVSVDMLNLTVS